MIAELVDAAFDLYIMVMLARVVLSWISVDRASPIVRWIEGVTEPVLRPIRDNLPAMGGLDLSPMLAILAIALTRGFVLGLL